MHPKFARRIATQIHLKKHRTGIRPEAIAKWILDRFPNLSKEDAAQVRGELSTMMANDKGST